MMSRAGTVLMLLASLLPAARAADSSATERLMRVADCIRDAGDLKGASREAFMNKCLGSEAALMASSKPKKTAPAAAPVLPAIPVTPVAPPMTDGLPPQERILGCASASKEMQGETRAAYLKDCLAGRIQSPAIDAEQAKRRGGCASQAANQASEGERQAFIAACMSNGGSAATAPARVSDELEMRRRAACNVMARDQQGAVRQAFIDSCIATPAKPARGAPLASATQSAQLSTRERLVRSKRCADAARAEPIEGGQVAAYMNTCMAQP